MSARRLFPSVLHGTCRAPPSKSYTHRALIAGHLTGRPYRVVNPLDAEDTRATARAIQRLGTRVRRAPGVWTLQPRPLARRPAGPVRIDCGESGTTLRFAAALSALYPRTTTLVGRGRLPTRPMGSLLAALRSLGATCRLAGGTRTLPLAISGPIHSGSVALDASESSQFASALLLTLPTLDGDSALRLTGRIVSRPYLDATLAVLARHRVRVFPSGRRFRVPGRQRYRGSAFRVPGDASSAAYLWAGAALSGGRVRVVGVPPDLPQADTFVLELLERAGASVRRSRAGIVVERRGDLAPFSVDLTDAPDLYPLAGVIAAGIPGRSTLRGASHVVAKESDRRVGTARLVSAMGARSRVEGDRLRIQGLERPARFAVTGLHDHRLVMSAAIGALVADGPSLVGDARAVEKSYPGFWRALAELAPGSVAG